MSFNLNVKIKKWDWEYILAVKYMKVRGTPDFKSNSSTVASTRVFHKLHSKNKRNTQNRTYMNYLCLFSLTLGTSVKSTARHFLHHLWCVCCETCLSGPNRNIPVVLCRKSQRTWSKCNTDKFRNHNEDLSPRSDITTAEHVILCVNRSLQK